MEPYQKGVKSKAKTFFSNVNSDRFRPHSAQSGLHTVKVGARVLTSSRLATDLHYKNRWIPFKYHFD